MALRSNVAVTP